MQIIEACAIYRNDSIIQEHTAENRNDRHSQLTEISYYWMMQYPKSGGLSYKNKPCTVQPFLKAFLTLSLTY